MKINDVMTKSVISVNSSEDVKRAASLMKEHSIGALPVVDNNKTIGIITDRDLVVRYLGDNNAKDMTLRGIMTSNPVVASPEMDTEDAARIMSERQIRRLPVEDKGKLVGMVALGDLAVENKASREAGEALQDISKPCSPQ